MQYGMIFTCFMITVKFPPDMLKKGICSLYTHTEWFSGSMQKQNHFPMAWNGSTFSSNTEGLSSCIQYEMTFNAYVYMAWYSAGMHIRKEFQLVCKNKRIFSFYANTEGLSACIQRWKDSQILCKYGSILSLYAQNEGFSSGMKYGRILCLYAKRGFGRYENTERLSTLMQI